MTKLDTLQDGLLDELKDLFSAENQLLKALPKMAKKASSPALKEAFTLHLGETQKHVERLTEISKIVNEKLSGKTCKAMKGLIEEGKEVIEEESENKALIDTLLIGAAQRVEHYEIAAYGTVRAIAKQLGEEEIVQFIEETLNEEKAADAKLTDISEGEVLTDAQSASDEDAEEAETSPKKNSSKNSSKSSNRDSQDASPRTSSASKRTSSGSKGIAATKNGRGSVESGREEGESEDSDESSVPASRSNSKRSGAEARRS